MGIKKGHIKDFYFHKAKREKYSARSVYKLKNIQDKYKVLSAANKVLDLGAAPGSWTEYLISVLGKKGELWSLDERPLSLSVQEKIKKSGITHEFLQQSVFEDISAKIPPLDAVVSDMAPFTSGQKSSDAARSLELVDRAYSLFQAHIKQGGHFIAKLFQSEESIERTRSWGKNFKFSKLYKPPSTHKESKEIYFVGMHYKP